MGWLRGSLPYRTLVRRVLPLVHGECVPGAERVAAGFDAPAPFEPDVSWQDEMFQHFYRPFARERALADYFRTGLETAAVLREVEESLGARSGREPSLLEFASGYGRNTRHLVNVYRGDYAVCELDPRAVAFARARFRVEAVPASADPEGWRPPRTFDRVFVASLFTHLPEATFGPWLERLAGALAPGGALVFTTHGLDWIGGDPTSGDAFVFRPVNETLGRLDGQQYGSTYVCDAWVERTLRERGLAPRGPLRRNALWGQDVWVVSPAGGGGARE